MINLVVLEMKLGIEKVLEELPRGVKYKYAEIGVYAGDNAESLLTLVPTERAWFVDPWSTSFSGYGHSQAEWDDLYTKTLKRVDKFPQAEILRMNSEQASKVVPDGLDFVYIDAAHDYENTLLDLQVWTPKVRLGGWIAGDDLSYDGVEKSLFEFLYKYSAMTQVPIDICVNSNQWWFQRRA